MAAANSLTLGTTLATTLYSQCRLLAGVGEACEKRTLSYQDSRCCWRSKTSASLRRAS
jgi:hypothetical protein